MKGSQGRRAPEKGAVLGGFARRASGLLIPTTAKLEQSPEQRVTVRRDSGLSVVKDVKAKTKAGPKELRRKKEKSRRKARAKNR